MKKQFLLILKTSIKKKRKKKHKKTQLNNQIPHSSSI